MVAIDVGDEAPDFELLDQHGQPVRLSDFRGKRAVVVIFYPYAFSRTCGRELCTLRDELHDFVTDEVQVVAVSIDSKFSLRAYAAQEGFTFPLLADFWPHGEVARRYGVFDERLGCAVRGTFIVDRDGIVRWRVVHGIPDARSTDAYRAALAELVAES